MNLFLHSRRDGQRKIDWFWLIRRIVLVLIGATLVVAVTFMTALQPLIDSDFTKAVLTGWALGLMALVVIPLIWGHLVALERLPESPVRKWPGSLFRLARFLFGWRMVRRYLFCLAVLATLILVFYTEENWRGKHAWERYKRQMEEKGRRLDRASFVPAPVPDAENFFMTPFLAPFWDFEPGTQQWRDTNGVDRARHFCPAHDKASGKVKAPNSAPSNTWTSPRPDLRLWAAAFRSETNPPPTTPVVLNKEQQAFYRRYGIPPEASPTELVPVDEPMEAAAAEVLSWLAPCEPVLEELRAASQRPYARANLKYDNPEPAGIFLPHLATLKHVCQVLQLRISAELALGRTDEAFEDVEMMFRLADSLRSEPVLVSVLVQISQLQILLGSLREGMNKWSDAQLRELETRLGQVDFCAEMNYALQAERAALGIGTIDYLRRSPHRSRAVASLGATVEARSADALAIVVGMMPLGWYYLEKIAYSEMFEKHLLPAIDVEHRRVDPRACEYVNENLNAAVGKPAAVLLLKHRFFSQFFLPAVPQAVRRTGLGQAGVDTAAIACALQRYRAAKGEFPESLEALSPEFMKSIPHDVISGQPYKYQRIPGGKYKLYSVGWNEKDDGGLVTRNSEGNPKTKEGDWVWE